MEWPRPLVAIDTETALISEEDPIPALTCLSVATEDGGVVEVYDHVEGVAIMRALLERACRQEIILVAHNAPFDALVLAYEDIDLLPMVFDAFAKDTFIDTLQNEKLFDIEAGEYDSENDCRWLRTADEKNHRCGYDLKGRIWLHFRESLDSKDDENSPRLKYGALRGVPIDEWTDEQFEYAADDAMWHLRLAQVSGPHHNAPDQSRAALWLALASSYGIAVDQVAVEKLAAGLEVELAGLTKQLQKMKVLRKNGSKNMKVIRDMIVAALGDDAPKTKGGAISTKREVCEEAGMVEVSDHISTQKLLNNYVAALREGNVAHSRFKALVATGRTSSSEPNIQNLPKKKGVRECYVPRPGYWFLDADYSTLELCTLGQTCINILGWSTLADAINDGLDPHLDGGRSLMTNPVSYDKAKRLLDVKDEEMKKCRQLMKVVNFGAPGGLGAVGLVGYMKGYDIAIDEARAAELLAAWRDQWPEMLDYFAEIKGMVNNGGFVTLHVSGRTRGDASFTEAANYFFQGPAADGNKAAGFEITRECWIDETSPLYGCNVVNFIHDEFILEVPADVEQANAAHDRLIEIMCREMKKFVPDVAIKADGHLMDRWYKNAGPVYNDEGLLIPYTGGA